MSFQNTIDTYQATKKFFITCFNNIWELRQTQGGDSLTPEQQSRHHAENSFDYLACTIGAILAVSAFFGALPAVTGAIITGFCLFLLIESVSHRFNQMGAIANINRAVASVALACGSALVLAGVFIKDCFNYAIETIAKGYSEAYAHGYFPSMLFLPALLPVYANTVRSNAADTSDQSAPEVPAITPEQDPWNFQLGL
jgi:predicted PurR-regulated permease PerM